MAETQIIYTCTPRQVSEFLLDIFYAGLVPYVRSSPGMGKSTLFKSAAKILNLKMIDHRLSTSEPTDLTGVPEVKNGRAKYAPFDDLFPLEGEPLPAGKDGWMVFLDEINAAPKQTQAASYKVVLDRYIGQKPLHDNVVLGMAGNLDTDRAITTLFSTAMQSRVITLEMVISFKEWLLDVALKEEYDPRIIAYLSQYESKLMDFRPDHNEKTFCCPRTWEFMNKLIKGKEVTDKKTPMYAGTITSGVAADFVAFTQIYKDLINVKEILADPKGCRVPTNNDIRWATVTHMMEKVDDKNFGDLSEYANRFSLDFRILYFRSTMVKHQHLRQHPAFSKAMVELSRYLNG